MARLRRASEFTALGLRTLAVVACLGLAGCSSSSPPATRSSEPRIVSTRFVDVIPEDKATAIRPDFAYMVDDLGGRNPLLSITVRKAVTGPVYRQAIVKKEQEKYYYRLNPERSTALIFLTVGLAGFLAAANKDVDDALMKDKISDGVVTFEEMGERTAAGRTDTMATPWPSASFEIVVRGSDGAIAGRLARTADDQGASRVPLREIFGLGPGYPADMSVTLVGVLGRDRTEIPVALSTEVAQRVASLLGRAQPAAPDQQVAGPTVLGASPLSVAFPRSGDNPDDIAVIIGNRNYAHGGRGIPDVAPAFADSDAMRRYASLALGVADANLVMVRDASQSTLVSLFGSETRPEGQIANMVKPGRSRIFVYYSGHGAPGASDRQSYLVPVDANPATLELNGYALTTLYRNLAKAPARSVTVVLESCFSGASQEGAVLPNASPVFIEPVAQAVPPGMTVVTASGAREVASWEPDKSFSIFTKHYLLGVAGEADKAPWGNGDGRVEAKELAAYLSETVAYAARRYYGRTQTVEFLAGGGRAP